MTGLKIAASTFAIGIVAAQVLPAIEARTAAAVLAQSSVPAAPATPESWLAPLTQLGATGILGIALLLTLWQLIPKIVETQRQSSETAHQRFDDALSKIVERHHEDMIEMRKHCAWKQPDNE